MRYDYSQYAVDPKKLQPQQVDPQKRGEADFLHFLGSIAPAAGGALGMGIGALAGGLPTGGIGAGPGAALGGAIGGGLGQLGGALANSGGDAVTADTDRANADKASRRAALMNVLMGLR